MFYDTSTRRVSSSRRAEDSHRGLIGGHEVAYDDAHGAVRNRLAAGVVVAGVNLKDVARGELIPTAIEEKDGGHAEQMARVIELGGQRGHGFLACGVFQNQLLGVVVHMAADA